MPSRPSKAAARRSAAIRVLAAVLLAAGLAAATIAVLWQPLDVSTDVVGYPTFSDFNVDNYITAYFLAVVFFPLAALGLFFLLTRLAPRIGLAPAPDLGPLRPLEDPDRQESAALVGEPRLADTSAQTQKITEAGRIAFVGAVLGFAAGIASDSLLAGLLIGTGAYALLVVLIARFAGPRLKPDWQPRQRTAAVNSLAAPLTLLGLAAVSMSTEVSIQSTGSVDAYPWFPLWVAVPAAAAVGLVLATRLRRRSAAHALEIERGAVTLIAAPVCLVLLLQHLPGPWDGIDMFHFGEQIAGARLVTDGLFPWRDVLLTHGIFQDVIYSSGRVPFGDSAWGHVAGIAMLMQPLYLVSLYFLFVYLAGRNWLLLLLAVMIVVGTTLVPEQFRLLLWPWILLLLASELDRPRTVKAVGLALLVVVQVALTPETAVAAVPAVAIVLLGYEWYRRRPQTSLRSRYSRTLQVGVAGVAFASLFAGYLAAAGALDDFVYLTTNVAHGHALSGGQPPTPGEGFSKFEFGVLALAPPVALLAFFAYFAFRLRLRRELATVDWVMAAAAVFLLVYYLKFLARMDTGHAYQTFVAGVPLMLFLIYRAIGGAEGALRDRWPRSQILRISAHPVSLVLVVVVAALSWGSLRDNVTEAPGRYQPTIGEPAQFERVGYAKGFDGRAYRDIQRVVDGYLGPDDRLFDFSNTPLLFFYLIDRLPSIRYFHASIVPQAELQNDAIERLAKARPKLIVFDNHDVPFLGLSSWDGIPNMVRHYELGEWILDHYRPLLWTHGFTIYGRRDVPPVSQLDLGLAEQPRTRQLELSVRPCSWGAAPNFLSDAALPPENSPSRDAHAVRQPNRITVIGWAGDPRAKLPAREVIATVDGKLVGRITPQIRRQDLVTYGLPAGFVQAGFQLQFDDAPGGRTGKVQLFAVSRDGGMSEIVGDGDKPSKGTVTIDGRSVRLDPKAAWGQINTLTRDRTVQFDLPVGSNWTDYGWLQVIAGGRGFEDGTLTIYDRQDRPSAAREISFETLDRSAEKYVVPLSNCAQWHGYAGRQLFLNFERRQDIAAVRLIREPSAGS